MNAVTKREEATLADFEEIDARALVEEFAARIVQERGAAHLPALPTQDERKFMARYDATLHRRLRPISEALSDREHATKAIAQMLTGWLGQMRHVDVEALIAAHVTFLMDVPLFAIIAACDDVRHNRVKGLDANFPPSSVVLLKQATSYIEDVNAERYKLKRVLAVDKVLRAPVSAEETARIAKKMKDLAVTLPAMDPFEASREAARRAGQERSAQISQRSILREYAHRKEPPPDGPLVSLELREMMERRRR